MSSLSFLNNIKRKNIIPLSVDLIPKEEDTDKEIMRLTMKLKEENSEGQIHLLIDMNNFKEIWFESNDLNLMKRKINPFQIRLFMLEALQLFSEENEKITFEVDNLEVDMIIRKINLFLIYYN